MGIENSVVVITGASGGIGAAFAEAIAAAGANVVLCSRNEAALSSECAEIKKGKRACSFSVVDVTKKAQVKSFIDKVIKDHGRLDCLINNAGAIHPKKPIESLSEEEYQACMATNTDGVFYFLQAVVPVMKKQNQGIIINISSGAGKKGYPGLSAYSASKFAVQGLTESVAKELESTPVRCIAICPGGVNTPMRAAVFGQEDAARQQSAVAVAEIVRDIILGKVKVPNGADVQIRNGTVTAVNDNLAR